MTWANENGCAFSELDSLQESSLFHISLPLRSNPTDGFSRLGSAIPIVSL
jgi:hypothetical protein